MEVIVSAQNHPQILLQTDHGMASSSEVRKENTIKFTVPWGPNSILVDPASIRVKYDTRDRRDASKYAAPHVALGNINKSVLRDKEFQLANLHSYNGPHGTSYRWEVVGLKHEFQWKAHFTVAWIRHGQPLPPLEDFDFKSARETDDTLCRDVHTTDENMCSSAHSSSTPAMRPWWESRSG